MVKYVCFSCGKVIASKDAIIEFRKKEVYAFCDYCNKYGQKN